MTVAELIAKLQAFAPDKEVGVVIEDEIEQRTYGPANIVSVNLENNGNLTAAGFYVELVASK